jgi:hypothetical protein
MGLTFKLGTIPLAILTDASNNVGIGAAPSGSYKLEVTGTAKVSSTLLVSGAATFGSSINSGAIQATASGAVIQLIGLASSNAYYVNDQTANSGKRWRFGHTGAVSGYNSFDFYNQTDNLLAMTITSAGNVSIGSTVDAAKLYVAGTFQASVTLASGYAHTLQNQSTASGASGVFIDAYASDSSSFALAVRTNNGNSYPFKIRCDGYLQSTTTYNNTTASPNYLSISSSGYFERYVASSQRYKEEIKDWDVNGLDIILALRPRTYKYKKEYYNKADVDFLGLIAEEVAEVNTYLADYENEDGTGQVENVRYATIVVPLIKAIQEQQATIQELNERLNKAGL